MKQLATALPLACVLLLVGCGDNGLSGTWRATLKDPSGNTAFVFTTTLLSSDNVVTVSNLRFTPSTPCFGAGSTETAALHPNSTLNGVITRQFRLTIQSGATGLNGNNALALTGTLNNDNTVPGTWTLAGTGAGCTGFGTFTMVRF